ncbi:hypothetical protein SQ11_11790 [Nitrosospira sp. NpAV]|nr:hypothetical protein SQ11_11790 [Nitrosospira sp. NpAV]
MVSPEIVSPKSTGHIIGDVETNLGLKAEVFCFIRIATPTSTNVNDVQSSEFMQRSLHHGKAHRVLIAAENNDVIFLPLSVDFEDQVMVS